MWPSAAVPAAPRIRRCTCTASNFSPAPATNSLAQNTLPAERPRVASTRGGGRLPSRLEKSMDNAARTRQRVLAVFLPVTAVLYISAEALSPKGTDQVILTTPIPGRFQ